MSQLDRLWDYQQAELELAKLNKEMKSSEAYRKRSALHKLLVEQKDVINGYEAELGENSARIDALRQQLEALLHDHELEASELEIMQNDELTTPEELTESRKALEKLVTRITALSRDLNSLIEWCEKITAAINDTFKRAARAKRDYDAIRIVCEDEKSAYAPKIDELNAELEAIKKGVSPELFEAYQTIKRNHAVPIARLVNGQCSGCHMALPAIVQKRVAAGTAAVRCENCGRLLLEK